MQSTYYVTHQDGTPPDEPTFVLSANDPASAVALLAYASHLKNRGDSDTDVEAILSLASEFNAWADARGIANRFRPLGNPGDAPESEHLW